ncbi:hypothetical protein ACQ4PT_063231 [Festuca glaucescens]
MASWLKVAEDLLEVVDRRAKSVATELSDEQPGSQHSGSSGQEGQGKRGKPREKGPLKLTTGDAGNKTGAQKERKNRQPPRERIKIEKIKPSVRADSLNVDATASANEPEVTSVDVKGANDEDTSNKGENISVDLKNDRGVNVINNAVEVQSVEKKPEDTGSVTDGVTDSGRLESASESSVPSVSDEKNEPSSSNQSTEIGLAVSLEDNDTAVAIIQERNISELTDTRGSGKSQDTKKDDLADSPETTETQQEHKSDSVPLKDQDQLEEAQGLLKSAAKSGQSKEARLARVCAGLSSRLQEYKSENAQLEELLVQEREKCSSHEAHIKQLQQELSVSRVQGSRVESNMVDALTAKNTEIESLAKSLDSWKKKAAASEEMLASLQEDMDGLKRNRELTETRIIQALREELSTVERRAEEERIAHNATKMAAVDREVELEHRAVEASNALARIQRAADQSSSRAMEFEHKVAVLEVECASLHQELQEMEARNRRAQKKPSEEANQVLQAELQKMRVEMAGMRRDAEHYSRQEHVELEKRYRELTDLLYHKQTQLESMASEKGALEFQLEKSLKQFHEVQVEAERSRVSRRSASSWEEDTDINMLEPLPVHHRHMATANHQVFVHLFLMYLMQRLQDFAAEETVKSSLGELANVKLP